MRKVIGEKSVSCYAYKAFESCSAPLKYTKLQLFQEIGHIKSSQSSQQLHTLLAQSSYPLRILHLLESDVQYMYMIKKYLLLSEDY